MKDESTMESLSNIYLNGIEKEVHYDGYMVQQLQPFGSVQSCRSAQTDQAKEISREMVDLTAGGGNRVKMQIHDNCARLRPSNTFNDTLTLRGWFFHIGGRTSNFFTFLNSSFQTLSIDTPHYGYPDPPRGSPYTP